MSYSSKYTIKERQIVRRIHDLSSYIRSAKIKQAEVKNRIETLQAQKEKLITHIKALYQCGKYSRHKTKRWSM